MSQPDSAPERYRSLQSKSFELRDIEMGIVKFRNIAKFHVGPKDIPQAAKYFCLGPARSGTTTMHRAFESVGLRSAHKAGTWPLADYDAFSDRGDYRPYRAYATYYRNAVFILNTRPVGRGSRAGRSIDSGRSRQDLLPI